jgi:phage-related protein
MIWTVLLFESSRNEKPVEQFIKNQQPQAKAKILHKVTLLQQYGTQLGMPHSKKLGFGVYELRIRGKEEIRILYCFKNKTVYLLHSFKKQTQKTPKKELEIAVQRLNSLNT